MIINSDKTNKNSIFNDLINYCSQEVGKTNQKFNEFLTSINKEQLPEPQEEQPIFLPNRFAVNYEEDLNAPLAAFKFEYYFTIEQEEIDNEVPCIVEEPKSIFSIIGKFLLHICSAIRNLLFAEESIDLKNEVETMSMKSESESSSKESLKCEFLPTESSIEPTLREPESISKEEYQKYDEIIQMMPTDKPIGFLCIGKLTAAFLKNFNVINEGAIEKHFLNLLVVAFDETHKETAKKIFALNKNKFQEYATFYLNGFSTRPYFTQYVLDFIKLAKLDQETALPVFENNDFESLLNLLLK